MATSNAPIIPDAPKPGTIKVDPLVARPPLKKAAPVESGTDSYAKLKSYVEAVMERHKQIETLFEGKPVAPTKTHEFKKFVDDTLAELTMRYVLFGTYSQPGPANASEESVTGNSTEERLKQAGFTVSQEKMTGLDPALASHPAALMALSEGADLIGDEDS